MKSLYTYLAEAISSGKTKYTSYKFPEKPTLETVKEWLVYHGYPDITKGEHPTQYLLDRKFVGFYEIDDYTARKATGAAPVICIVNGDGEYEYRLFFDIKKSYELTSLLIVKKWNGRLDTFNLICDKDGIDALRTWLEAGRGIRESVSSGRHSKYFELEIDEKTTVGDVERYLESQGYSKTSEIGLGFIDSKERVYRTGDDIGIGSNYLYIRNGVAEKGFYFTLKFSSRRKTLVGIYKMTKHANGPDTFDGTPEELISYITVYKR